MPLFLLLTLALVASPQAPTPGASPEPPKLRLPAVARPIRQTVELTLVPDKEAFSGTTEIELQLLQPTSLLWLNASRLTIKDAKLVAGGATSAARAVAGGEDFVGFAFEKRVGPGKAQLRIDYEGVMSRRDTEGLFAQQEGGDWYVFSQFEPLAARRAFPGFDEPSYKIPWTVRLRVPKQLVAVSNAPETGTVEAPDGTKTVSFAETPPMPSYLVALGVGPFELVDAGRAGRNKVPLRILTPRGRGGDARFAKETSPAILQLLEDYFDIPYPYAKLDQIAIPITVAFGAMENAGLITYGQSILLRRPDEETVNFRRGFADTAAHEMAHMWFGDLVTTAWWDDIWLNEAFASWMGTKVMQRFKPEWDAQVQRVGARGFAMNQDSLASARRIRQPVVSNHDIVNAFDGITYSKGEVVLGMFESWLGEVAFRKGVQQYLKKHSWGNASAKDFVESLSAASGRDLAGPFDTFLEQSGVPVVTAKLTCATGRPWLLLSQRPYRPIGAEGADSKSWQVPVCVEHAAAPGKRQCTLLGSKGAEVALENASSCPAWVQANDEAAGYYRVVYPNEQLDALLRDGGRQLSISERVALLQDLAALARSGDVAADQALAVVPRVLQDPSRHLASAASALVAAVARGPILPEAARPRLRRFLREIYGERARALGFRAKPGEDEDTRLLRASLVGQVALAGDPELGAQSLELARRWLADPGAIDPDMVETVLSAAGYHGDRALFESYLGAARVEKDRLRRQRMLRVLGSFHDPAIAKDALQVLLDPAFEARESIGILFGATIDRETRQLGWNFLKDNYDALVARTPGEAQASLVFAANAFCDPQARADAEAFFKPRVASVLGGPRNLARVLEGIDLCIAYKDAQLANVLKFLERY